MSFKLKITTSVLMTIWLFLGFHFGWEKLCHMFPESIAIIANNFGNYVLFWLLGIGLGGVWIKSKKSMLIICLAPILFLMLYGLFLKGVQLVFGYGEIHKTLRQILSLFRTPGFLILFFTWLYLKPKIT
ncbi:MAG: hypothetical protein ACI8ZO_001016 [Flavobacteriales bacterium]|jgi:hypothetical protein